MENMRNLMFETLDVKDVCELLHIKKSTAYEMIKKLNDELKAQGKITMKGRVSRLYFESKFFH